MIVCIPADWNMPSRAFAWWKIVRGSADKENSKWYYRDWHGFLKGSALQHMHIR